MPPAALWRPPSLHAVMSRSLRRSYSTTPPSARVPEREGTVLKFMRDELGPSSPVRGRPPPRYSELFSADKKTSTRPFAASKPKARNPVTSPLADPLASGRRSDASDWRRSLPLLADDPAVPQADSSAPASPDPSVEGEEWSPRQRRRRIGEESPVLVPGEPASLPDSPTVSPGRTLPLGSVLAAPGASPPPPVSPGGPPLPPSAPPTPAPPAAVLPIVASVPRPLFELLPVPGAWQCESGAVYASDAFAVSQLEAVGFRPALRGLWRAAALYVTPAPPGVQPLAVALSSWAVAAWGPRLTPPESKWTLVARLAFNSDWVSLRDSVDFTQGCVARVPRWKSLAAFVQGRDDGTVTAIRMVVEP